MLDNENIDANVLAPGFLISKRYEIQRFIGCGGMGNVYLASDRLLTGNDVAVKVLHREYVRDSDLRKRFLREVQLMHRVNHPNVIRTYDVGTDRELIYFTMEFVSGVSLDECEFAGYVDLSYLETFLRQICEGLNAIHDADIVHRDLKPGNIMVLPDNKFKIADFGVARPISSQITQHNEIIGSVNYMAPEVLQGIDLSPAVDFYSLGVILYELATGELPFNGTQPVQLMWMHVNEAPRPPQEISLSIPDWLNHLILQLMAKSPLERPRDSREIIRYLSASPERRASAVLSAGRYSFAAAPDSTTDELSPDEPESSDEESQETSSGSLRSACSAIIFSSFPTLQEVHEHKKVAKERKKHDNADSSGSHPALPEVEAEESEPAVETAPPEEDNTTSKFLVVGLVMLLTAIVLGLAYFLIYSEKAPANRVPELSSADSSGSFSLPKISFKSWFGKNSEPPRSGSNSPFSLFDGKKLYDSEYEESDRPFDSLNRFRDIFGALSELYPTETDSSSAHSQRSNKSTKHGGGRIDRWYSRYFFNDSPDSAFTTDSLPQTAVGVFLDKGGPTSSTPPKKLSARDISAGIHPFSLDELRDLHPNIAVYLEEVRHFSLDEARTLSKIDTGEEARATYAEKIFTKNRLYTISSTLNALLVETPEDLAQHAEKLRSLLETVVKLNSTTNESLRDSRALYEFWLRQKQDLDKNRFQTLSRNLEELNPEIKPASKASEASSVRYTEAIEQQALGTAQKITKKELGSLRADAKTKKKALKNILSQLINEHLDTCRSSVFDAVLALDFLQTAEDRINEELRIIEDAEHLSSEEKQEQISGLEAEQQTLSERLSALEEKLPEEEEVLMRRVFAFSKTLRDDSFHWDVD